MSDDIKKQFWKELADNPIVMLGQTGARQHQIPMHAQLDSDANSAFWFFTTTDNRVAGGGSAMAQFVSKDHHLFACISGTLRPESDRAVLDRLWSNAVAAWYDGGKDDPKLLLLRFELENAEIWTADPGIAGKFKLAVGMKIKESDIGEHAKVPL
jgi:general stress protein 26